ncbi:DsbA family protein [Rhodobium gokarnense]|uniref:Protein-disulfide isomerase n=1 Tax=Rhodobium gokarnense TaxID=364296 RepID=A0ABT3HCU0_9HYPH|nr:DsbA family protein [Rhodobium gokarnense]MCW2308231.1 protein-disulfide isomerase [Rhodobium gokarnense]
MTLSRRTFAGLGAAALSAAAFGAAVRPALSQESGGSPDKLMVPGPLGEHVLGEESAPVTIIEYASLTCGHCANFHEHTFPELKKRYVDTGKVRFIFREFPLDQPQGVPLATAGFALANCAPEGTYFDVIGLLFEKLDVWAGSPNPANALFDLVKQVGFTQDSFRECLTNQEVLDGVTAVRNRAHTEFGVSSTPTFFINGKMVRGAMSIDEMAELIDPLLKS